MRLYSTLPRLFARIRKADADSTISQPRYGRNQPPLNHDSTILRVESKNDFDTTIPHPRSLNRQHRAARPWLVHQLPRPSRYFLHHPRREGDRQAAGNAAMSAAGGDCAVESFSHRSRGVAMGGGRHQEPHPFLSLLHDTVDREGTGRKNRSRKSDVAQAGVQAGMSYYNTMSIGPFAPPHWRMCMRSGMRNPA